MRLKNAILSRLFSQKEADLRAYPRFPIVEDRIAFAFFKGEPLGRIREISYGGFSVEKDFRHPSPVQNEQNPMTIQLLDGKFDFLARLRTSDERSLGFAFQYESLQTFEFLQRYLPFIKFGAALRYLIQKDSNDHKELPPLLAHDEGIRASFEIDGYDENQIPLTTVELGENGLFYKLVRGSDGVKTWHSIGPGGASGTLHRTPNVDALVLRKTLSFFIGYASADYQMPVGRLIRSLLGVADQNGLLPPYPRSGNTHTRLVPARKVSTASKRKPR